MWTKSDREDAEMLDGVQARRERWTPDDEAAVQEMMKRMGQEFPDIESPF